jgi:hypothetical protein
MPMFSCVAGPVAGRADEFFRRLDQIGGSPAGRQICPHAPDDRKALHLVDAPTRRAIRDHLERFRDLDAWGDIVEVRAAPRSSRGSEP